MTQYTKPGVYISGYTSPTFNKEVEPEPSPEFKIGDRVKVLDLNMDVSPGTYPDYERTLNQFGRVASNEGALFRVHFPQFADYVWYLGKQLKKEFAVGDKVLTRERRFGHITAVATSTPDDGSFINQYHIQYDDPTSGPDSARFANVWGEECLTYIPEEKKEAEGAGTVSINGKEIRHVIGWDKAAGDKTPIYELKSNMDINNFAVPNDFSLNQPITLDRGTHKSAIKFLNSGDDNIEVLKTTIKDCLNDSLDKRDNTSIMQYLVNKDSGKRDKSMSTVFENIYGVQTTYSATIVLANGAIVNIPDPDAKAWELKRITKFDEVYPCFIDSDDRLRISCFDEVFFAELADEHARCWAKDMARIVNEEIDNGPFEKHFSYVSEIREYVRKPVEKPEEYPCCYSTLRTLW